MQLAASVGHAPTAAGRRRKKHDLGLRARRGGRNRSRVSDVTDGPFDRSALSAALALLPADTVGAEPDRLVALVGEAAAAPDMIAGEGMDDIVGAGQQAAFWAAQSADDATLGKLIGAAAALPPRDPPLDIRQAAALTKPWTATVDMRRSLLDRRLVVPPGADPATYREQVEGAIDVLAAVRLKRGPYDMSPGRAAARTAVRAAYYHRHQQGLSLTVDWADGPRIVGGAGRASKPGQPVPKTATAKLALALVHALAINADAASVKEHLRAYHAEVRARGTPPVCGDFMPPA